MTQDAPAAMALVMSPLWRMPPSAMIGMPAASATLAAEKIAATIAEVRGPLAELERSFAYGRVVREGLSSNDWVVVSGLMSARPGMAVMRASASRRQPLSAACKWAD